jgi:hypothetical protein
MQIQKISLSKADIEFLQQRAKQLKQIGLQQATKGEDYMPTQDACFRVELWLLEDQIINKKNYAA